MKRGWGTVAFGLVAVVAATSARASTPNNWTGVASNLWNNASNWSAGHVPVATEDVTIQAATIQNVQVNVSGCTCNSLTIGGVSSPQSLTINNTTTTLSVATTITIGSLGTITIAGPSSSLQGAATIAIQTGGTLVVSGPLNSTGNITVQLGGTFNLAGGTVSGPSQITVNSSGAFNVSNGGALSTATGVTVNSSGITNWNGTANFDLSNGSTFNNLAGAVFTVDTSTSTGGLTLTNTTGTAAFVNSGTFSTSGGKLMTVNSTIPFTNNGSLIVSAATDSLSVIGLTNYSVATGTLTSGTYTLLGPITPTSSITDHLSTIAANVNLGGPSADIKSGYTSSTLLPQLTNIASGGTLALSNGFGLTTSSSLSNAGTLSIAGAATALSVTGTYTQTAGLTVLVNGGSMSASTQVLLQGGSLTANNSTMINASVNNAAQIMVLAGQTLTISGSYTQTSGGTLAPFIASPTSVGLLAVTGVATLGGTVNANIQAAYTPAPGDTWKVITFASTSGQFSTVLPTLTMNALAVSQVVTATSISLQTGAAPPPPIISLVTSSLPVAETNTPVTFTATATDPTGLPLTYSWNFGDGSPVVTGNPVTYSYLIEGNFTVTVTVSNPGTSASDTLPIATFAPNSGGQGVSNIGVGTTVTDPLTDLGMTIMNSDGGVIELGIDVSNLRAPSNVSTEMDGIGSRSSAVPGTSPIFKATSSGVYVATATATDPTTNALKGKGRLTIAVSGGEVGQSSSTTPPKNSKLSKVKLKGKFTFPKADSLDPLAGSVFDTVGMSGTIELPAGFDLSSNHEIDIGIGNIIDAMQVNAKGKAILPGGGKVVKKLGIKYPRLKGTTKTSAGQTATISLTMAGSNFSGNGFDTEGITNNVTAAEKAAKSINRSIQMAVVVDGTPYTFMAPVSFQLSKTGDTGTMGTRSGP
jgi:hypothetical protein